MKVKQKCCSPFSYLLYMQYMNEQLLKFLAMGLLLPSLASERKVFRDLADTSKKAKRRKMERLRIFFYGYH